MCELKPGIPAGPCGPGTPAGPAGPGGPVSPFAPCGPAGPESPFGPGGPWPQLAREIESAMTPMETTRRISSLLTNVFELRCQIAMLTQFEPGIYSQSKRPSGACQALSREAMSRASKSRVEIDRPRTERCHANVGAMHDGGCALWRHGQQFSTAPAPPRPHHVA